MKMYGMITWLSIILASVAWYAPRRVFGLIPDKGPLDVVVCDNTSDSFSICWSPTIDPSSSGYCSFLENTFRGISEDTYHPRPDDSSSVLKYTFGRLQLTSTYKGCVFPVPDSVRDDEGCDSFWERRQNVSCTRYTPDGRGLNLQNGLAIGCAGYLLFMYMLLRISNIVCPYSRKSNLTYEDFFLHGEGEKLSRRTRKSRETEQRRANSIKERARKRSEAISEVLTSPPRSPRSPSTLSEISETSGGTRQ